MARPDRNFSTRATFGAALLLLALTAHAVEDDERAALRSFLENTITASESFEDRYAAEVWLVDMGARLAPHDQLRALGCAVAPDLGIVAVVAND